MAKKWPGMVVQRSFIKEHLFVNRLYVLPLIDSNYESINGASYIKEKKVMNSSHGHYRRDSLPLL